MPSKLSMGNKIFMVKFVNNKLGKIDIGIDVGYNRTPFLRFFIIHLHAFHVSNICVCSSRVHLYIKSSVLTSTRTHQYELGTLYFTQDTNQSIFDKYSYHQVKFSSILSRFFSNSL